MLRQGYKILVRNYTCRSGEIDRIADHRGTLCFVEVKARAGDAYGPAIAAVSPQKQRRIARVASNYLAHHPTDRPCRFDVIGLDQVAGEWRFTWIRDAFSL